MKLRFMIAIKKLHKYTFKMSGKVINIFCIANLRESKIVYNFNMQIVNVNEIFVTNLFPSHKFIRIIHTILDLRWILFIVYHIVYDRMLRDEKYSTRLFNIYWNLLIYLRFSVNSPLNYLILVFLYIWRN